VSVNQEGQSKLEFDGPGKHEITTNQVIAYLAAEIEKFELMMVTERIMNQLKSEAKAIQVVKNIPNKFKLKQ